MLTLSNDRKTANKVNAKGTRAAMPNAFGLPAGHSCPGMTSACASICYASNIERYPSVSGMLKRNWDLVRNADPDTLIQLIDDMVCRFIAECDRRQAPKLFRIHWDGDFFSDDYARAWGHVIAQHPDVRFWAYTRNAKALVVLIKMRLDNLALYFSADADNEVTARVLRRTYGTRVRIAYLAGTFSDGQARMRDMAGKPVGKCPENAGRIPLISTEGSACARCRLCITGKTDIVFSSTGK